MASDEQPIVSCQISAMRFQRFGHPAMQLFAASDQQALIGHFLGQCVLENVFDFRFTRPFSDQVATLELVDTMPDADRVAQLRGVAASVPGVAGVDKAFARKTGFTWHVDIHVEVDPAMTVAASHEIAGAVRRRVRSEVRWVADVLVHVEPAGG